jgi:hypothetical protein
MACLIPRLLHIIDGHGISAYSLLRLRSNSSVAKPHRFDANPDPVFNFAVDPDPDSTPHHSDSNHDHRKRNANSNPQRLSFL